MKIKSTFFVILLSLISISGFAQGNPAVTSRNITPVPLAGAGSTYVLSTRIGNFGADAISGADAANRMRFVIQFSKCQPENTADLSQSLSGPLVNYFDITYNSTDNSLEGIQKLNVALPVAEIFDLTIASIVTQNSADATDYSIGASFTVIPNTSAANSNANDDDLATIYTRSTQLGLPVSLISFTAQAQENRTVLLNWKTSWERNNKGYIVERSKDLTTFEAVGEVNDVAGSSNNISSYQFVDNKPYRGTSYYRLRQVDLNGRSEVFKAESVIIDGKYGIYPNPVVSTFTLNLDEPSSAELHLYNVSGSEIGVDKLGQTEITVNVKPLSALSTGIYVLTVEERGTFRTHRFVVK